VNSSNIKLFYKIKIVARVIHEKILVCIDSLETIDFAVEHGLEICSFSRKELILLHILDKKKVEKEKKLLDATQLKMKNLLNEISIKFNIPINGYVLEGDKYKLSNTIAEKLGVAIILFQMDEHQEMDNKTLKMIHSSRLPYIIIKQKLAERGYKNILFPVDPSVKSKEKVLWAIFFSVHYNSVIHLFFAKHPDKPIDRDLQQNIFYAKKTFESFHVNYRIHELEGSSWDIHDKSLAIARNFDAGLLIMMMTRHYGLFDYILGPYEKKFIKENKNIPVMCINSRDDLYVPCI